MREFKKNNKGFSLVELIVVVLIMAIIAVALAPQVMKWVDNSRIATDLQTQDSMVSAATYALTDSTVAKEVKTANGITIKLTGKTITYTPTATGESTTAFSTAFRNYLNADPALKSSYTSIINVSATGAVSIDTTTADTLEKQRDSIK